MTTGERIKNVRKTAGLTQRELGEKLGLSYQAVAQWENDLRNPKRETLQRIADALGVDLYEIQGDAERIADKIGSEFNKLSKQYHDAMADLHQLETLGQKLGLENSDITAVNQHQQVDDSNALKERLLDAYNLLNQHGKEKAVERVEELLQIPEYQIPGYYYYFYDESGELKKTMRGPTNK